MTHLETENFTISAKYFILAKALLPAPNTSCLQYFMMLLYVKRGKYRKDKSCCG
jgi:hypothetical protein